MSILKFNYNTAGHRSTNGFNERERERKREREKEKEQEVWHLY
jgi:hypothetical protein